MIEKINSLKSKTQDANVKALCEKAISTLNEGIYQNIPSQAKVELENAVIKGLFEKLSAVKENETREWLKNAIRLWSVRNLGVRESVNSLSVSEAKGNESLKQTLDFFREQLETEPEVLLYESFITAMQSFNYFPKVGNAVQAIKDRVDSYESDVSIAKIMETMKRTRSNYLVPIIEDLVQNYLDNKTEQTKSSLKEGLIKFSYDPFIRDIINLVTVDATNLQLEYANASCDIEKVFSPVLYIGENEAVFGVRGSFYIKKGNTLSRLNKDSIKRLDPEFVTLCEAINNPNVVIDGKTISVYGGSDKAVISDKGVALNGQEFTNEDYQNSAKIAKWTGKGNFLSLVEMLRKNFNEIAEVDFAKRVFLKENREYAADVFKLRDNVSITTFDPQMGKGIFYRNVNPIQAKKLMMEHLRFDMSGTFRDLLPAEEKINEEIEETKKAYSECITDLEKKILEFKSNPYPSKAIPSVIQALAEELSDVKNEYKDYLNLVESHTRIPKGDISEAKITLDIEGPLAIEVNGQKYTVPIPESPEGEGEVGKDEFGTEVGGEDVAGEPASAITFDDTNTELLGDSPSIQADEVNLGSDEIAADADAAEAEGEIAGEEGEEGAEGEEAEGEGGEELGGDLGGELGGEEGEEGEGDEGEIKVGDEEELDLGLGGEESEEEEEVEKVEDSTSNSKPKELKKKVYLKKRKVHESLNEHHINDKKGQVKFIMKNKKNCKHSKEELLKMDDKKIEKMYKDLEKEMGVTK
jgi:hypothetical protein